MNIGDALLRGRLGRAKPGLGFTWPPTTHTARVPFGPRRSEGLGARIVTRAVTRRPVVFYKQAGRPCLSSLAKISFRTSGRVDSDAWCGRRAVLCHGRRTARPAGSAGRSLAMDGSAGADRESWAAPLLLGGSAAATRRLRLRLLRRLQ